MAPSAQNPVSPSANTLTANMREWIVGNRRDLYTYALSECNVIATWTAEGITSLMHVTGADVNTCITNLANHIHNTPGTVYVIAAAGPDNATQNWFIDSWYTPLKNAVLAKPVLTTADKARIRWVAPDFNLLKHASAATRGTFALLESGRYGPSNAPPRPASSSSSSSGSSFGNKGPLTSARPSSSKGGSPARPSSSGSAASGRGAPTASKTTAPAKKVAAAPVKKR